MASAPPCVRVFVSLRRSATTTSQLCIVGQTSVQAVLACNCASTASGPSVPHPTTPCQFAK